MELAEAALISTAKERQLLFRKLYEDAFPKAAKFVAKMNGSFDDAKDIFQDALVIYYEKSRQENFQLRNPPEAYLLGISKHLWAARFKKDRKNISLNEFEAQLSLSKEEMPAVNTNRILNLLESSGKKCLELLHAFYYAKLSLREISQSFSFRSEHSASVQKYKCIEKLRETVKSKSISYEDFTE